MNVCWIYCGQANQISAADSPSVGSDQSQSVECPASSMTRRSDLTVAEWSPRRLGAVTVRQRATDVRFTGVGGVRTTGSLDRPSGRQMFGNSNARTELCLGPSDYVSFTRATNLWDPCTGRVPSNFGDRGE